MMKKFWAAVCAAALILSMGVTNVLAAGADAATETPQSQSEAWMPRGGGTRTELTEEQKAQMEAERAQREEEQNAFLATLTDEQRALYDAMTAAMPAKAEPQPEGTQDTEQPARPDEADMEAMKKKREAFTASLSEEQKTRYEELFSRHGRGGHGGMTEEQRAEMEEKIAAFKALLNEEQTAALEAMMPAMPVDGVASADGERPQKPDETDRTAMMAQKEAFEATLSEEQKTAYDEIFAKPERLDTTEAQTTAA